MDGETAIALPTHVDLRAEYESSGVKELLDELDQEMIGLKPVKERLRETAALLLVERARKSMGLSHQTPTLHMSFTGNPGTGKNNRRHEDGRIAQAPRLCPERTSRFGNAGRSGRAVHWTYSAQDQGSVEARHGWRVVH